MREDALEKAQQDELRELDQLRERLEKVEGEVRSSLQTETQHHAQVSSALAVKRNRASAASDR